MKRLKIGEVYRIELADARDYLEYRPGSGGTVEIWDIAVGSERRKGKGRALIQTLFTYLDQETRVYAITRADNEVAQQFYEKLRFTVANPLRRFYSPDKGIDAVMYGRKAGGPV